MHFWCFLSIIKINSIDFDEILHSSQDSWKTWKTMIPSGILKFHLLNLEDLELAWKKLKKHLEFEIFQMNFDFAKILMGIVDFRKLQSIDQRLPFWKACVKSTWNFTVRFEFYTWKFGIFHLENLELSFEKSCFVFKQSLLILNTSQKSHVLEKSGSGCTVVARPLYMRRFFDFFCVIPHYDKVM